MKRVAFLKLLGAAGVGSALPLGLGRVRSNLLSMNDHAMAGSLTMTSVAMGLPS